MNTALVKAGVILFALIAVAIGGYAFGVHTEHNANEAQKKEDLQTAIELHRAKTIAGGTVERETVQRAAKTETTFNAIQQGVVTYAQNHAGDTDCRLDDDGLRLWADANAGAIAPGVAERHADLPGRASGAAEWLNPGSSDQPRRLGQDLPPVQGSAQRPGQVAGENQ